MASKLSAGHFNSLPAIGEFCNLLMIFPNSLDPKSGPCMDPEWGTGDPDNPLKNHQNLGFLSNTGTDALKSHKATKPEFNVVLSSACQQNTI